MYPRTPQSSLPIADQLWLMSHTEQSGRPRLAADILGLGLAGAVLSELLLEGWIVLAEQHHVFLTDAHYRGRDPVLGWAVAEIAGLRSSVPVGRWLPHLCDQVEPRIAGRLADAGLVEFVKSGLFGGRRRAVPADANLAVSPRVRILHQLDTNTLDPVTTMLGALAVSLGLDSVIGRDVGRNGLRDGLVSAARTLSPDLIAVANGVRSAASQATMSIRR